MYLQTVQKKTENADLFKNCLIYSQQVERERKTTANHAILGFDNLYNLINLII